MRFNREAIKRERENSKITVEVTAEPSSVDDWLIRVEARRGPVFAYSDYILKSSHPNRISSADEALSETRFVKDVFEEVVQKCLRADPENENGVIVSSLRAKLRIPTILRDGWDDCLDDDEWGTIDPEAEGVRFGPGFTDEERQHAAKLVLNDEELGHSLNLYGRFSNRDYWVYPLRSGAFALAVHNDADATYVVKYDNEDDFIARHGTHKIQDDEAIAQLQREVVAAGGGAYRPVPDDESGYDDDDLSPR